MNYYEVIIIYDTDYGEVTVFQTDQIMNDSNDIISYAVRHKLIEEKYRGRVRWAKCVSKYEYIEIKRQP